MFLLSDNISFDIISVLDLEWISRDDASGIRPYHALSYRMLGDSEFRHPNHSLNVGSGDIVFMPAYYEYHQKSTQESLLVIHFSSEAVLPQTFVKYHTKNPAYFERKFREMYASWTKKQFGYIYECKSIFYRIIQKLEVEYANSNGTAEADYISEAVDYIHENFTNPELSVTHLVQMCNMSDTYFRKLFVKKTSVTPLRYINNLRLNYAEELLKSGYYSINEVSDMCGFCNVSYFSRYFKQEKGHSPSKV